MRAAGGESAIGVGFRFLVLTSQYEKEPDIAYLGDYGGAKGLIPKRIIRGRGACYCHALEMELFFATKVVYCRD